MKFWADGRAMIVHGITRNVTTSARTSPHPRSPNSFDSGSGTSYPALSAVDTLDSLSSSGLR
jgi:hypothetical protein